MSPFLGARRGRLPCETGYLWRIRGIVPNGALDAPQAKDRLSALEFDRSGIRCGHDAELCSGSYRDVLLNVRVVKGAWSHVCRPRQVTSPDDSTPS